VTERDSVGDERVARLNQATQGRPSIRAAQVTRVEIWERPPRKLYFSKWSECALSAGPVELAIFHQRNDRLLAPRSQQSWKSLSPAVLEPRGFELDFRLKDGCSALI
jgi:hypothetical protein